MTDNQALAMPPWSDLIAWMEATDPAEVAEKMSVGLPDTPALVAAFPELASVDVHDISIDGPHGDVPAKLYRVPDTAANAAFVWVHGGAFVFGDLTMPESHWVSLMLASRGFPVLSLEYRKCLRAVHFPVPSDDVLAGWLWAVAHADELGISPDRLHLGGASAGGNLVAGVTKRLHDGAGPMPASLVLVYPVVHQVLPPSTAELDAAFARIPGAIRFPVETSRDINAQFLGTQELVDDPYSFAANGDASGQPPVYILNSEADDLRVSGEAYAEQLRAAGVDVTVEFEPGTQHGQLNEYQTPGGRRSVERLVQWLQARSQSSQGESNV